jgi:Rrf2 family protein
MKISTNSRYGLRALIYISQYKGDKPVTRQEISENIDVSENYLQSILKKLKDIGMINTFKGPGGGYRLSRPANEINLFDIIDSLETTTCLLECLDKPETCCKVDDCLSRPVWDGLSHVIQEYLSQYTLIDVAQNKIKV